jgi:hypothetical protein
MDAARRSGCFIALIFDNVKTIIALDTYQYRE